MPAAKKKPAAEAASKPEQNRVDVDALLKEAGFAEPEKVTVRWRGRDWLMTPVSAVNPLLLSEMGSVAGVVDVLRDALGDQFDDGFPIPRGVELPDGSTEMSVFLDAWSDASGESADAGE